MATDKVWVIFGVVVAVLGTINSIEMPFARSLVQCEVPTDSTTADEFTGSKLCNDRLHVIQEGTKLSTLAQSQESLARCIVTLFLGTLADVIGRRKAVLIGLIAVTSSSYLFIIASQAPAWAHGLFVVGQGLQGFSGMDLLSVVIAGDLAQSAEQGDSTKVYMMKDMAVGIAFLSCTIIGGAINMMEILDYTFPWMLMAVVSTSVLIYAWFYFPETQTASEDMKKRTMSQIMQDEVSLYRELLFENRMGKICILESMFYGPMNGLFGIIPPLMMAYHTYTQRNTVITQVFFVLFGLACMPLALAVLKKKGYVDGWTILVRFRILIYVTVFMLPLHWSSAYFCLFAYNMLGGAMNIIQDVRFRIVGQRLNAKYNALDTTANFAAAVITSLVYHSIFTAKPKNFMERMAPIIFALSSYSVNYAIYWLLLHSEYKKHLKDMQAEVEVADKKKAS